MTYGVSRYLSVHGASFPAFLGGPDQIVFLSTLTGVPQVWTCRVGELGDEPFWPDPLTFGANRVAGVWTSPKAGDRRLIFARDAGGNERMQLHLIDLDRGAETALTAGFESSIHSVGRWMPDGETLLFISNRRNLGLFDLYSMRIAPGEATGEPRLIWRSETPGYVAGPVVDPYTGMIYATKERSSFEQDLLEIDTASGSGRVLPLGQGTVRNAPIGIDATGRLWIATDVDSDTFHLATLDPVSGQLETRGESDWDLSAVGVSPDRRTMAYALNVEGYSEVHLIDLETGRDRLAPVDRSVIAFSDGRLAFSQDGKRLAFSSTSAVRAADVSVWSLETDAVSRITRSSMAGIPEDTLTNAELICYPTFDQGEDGGPREIPAWFYRTKTDARSPAIIVVHGGPEGQSRPFFQGMIQYFTAHGYHVLAPNVRGSVGYGKAYAHLDDVEKRMDSVADLAHAAQWLRAQPEIDPDQVVVFGGSYGGFMVLSAMTTYPNLWAAGVDIVGISSFVTFLENTSEYRRAHREAEYGSLAKDREFLESISPLNHIDKIQAPLMVIHGANDPRVPLSEAQQLVSALEAREIPVEFLVFDDEGHGLAKRKNQIAAYEATVAFLETHLSGGVRGGEQ